MSEVKRVTDDLGREILSRCCSAQSATWTEWAERAAAASGIEVEE